MWFCFAIAIDSILTIMSLDSFKDSFFINQPRSGSRQNSQSTGHSEPGSRHISSRGTGQSRPKTENTGLRFQSSFPSRSSQASWSSKQPSNSHSSYSQRYGRDNNENSRDANELSSYREPYGQQLSGAHSRKDYSYGDRYEQSSTTAKSHPSSRQPSDSSRHQGKKPTKKKVEFENVHLTPSSSFSSLHEWEMLDLPGTKPKTDPYIQPRNPRR